uniref:Uncharacterized protein n=1 Tax=Anguilla anguilla TaxID=7936 RepID=A0A0E9SDR1_ANGAN
MLWCLLRLPKKREPLPTLHTPKWPLACVNILMSFKIT